MGNEGTFFLNSNSSATIRIHSEGKEHYILLAYFHMQTRILRMTYSPQRSEGETILLRIISSVRQSTGNLILGFTIHMDSQSSPLLVATLVVKSS